MGLFQELYSPFSSVAAVVVTSVVVTAVAIGVDVGIVEPESDCIVVEFESGEAYPVAVTWGKTAGKVRGLVKVNGLVYALPSSALPASAIPSEALPASAIPSKAIPSNAIPSNGIPSNAIPSYALPASVVAELGLPAGGSMFIDVGGGMRGKALFSWASVGGRISALVKLQGLTFAIPSNAIPSNAIPSNAIPSNAIPSNTNVIAAAALKDIFKALPSNAIPSNAIPSNATLMKALPASILFQEGFAAGGFINIGGADGNSYTAVHTWGVMPDTGAVLFLNVSGLAYALPASEIPRDAIQAGALPASALPDSGALDRALPASHVPRALPSSALPASALPSSAIPSNAIPSNAIPAEMLATSALPSSLVADMGFPAGGFLELGDRSYVTFAWGEASGDLFAVTNLGNVVAAIPSNNTGLRELLAAKEVPSGALPLSYIGAAIPSNSRLDAIPAEMTSVMGSAITGPSYEALVSGGQAMPTLSGQSGALGTEGSRSRLAPGFVLDSQVDRQNVKFSLAPGAAGEQPDVIILVVDDEGNWKPMDNPLGGGYVDLINSGYQGDSYGPADNAPIMSSPTEDPTRFNSPCTFAESYGAQLASTSADYAEASWSRNGSITMDADGRLVDVAYGGSIVAAPIYVAVDPNEATRFVLTRDGVITVVPTQGQEFGEVSETSTPGQEFGDTVSDEDSDGFLPLPYGPDCDDSDPGVHPDADEIRDDGIDQNCDGIDAVSETQTVTAEPPPAEPPPAEPPPAEPPPAEPPPAEPPPSTETVTVSAVEIYGSPVIGESFVYNGNQQCDAPFTTEIDVWIERRVDGVNVPSTAGDIQSANMTWSVANSLGSKPMSYLQTDLWIATLGPLDADTVNGDLIIDVTVYITSLSGVTSSGTTKVTLRDCPLALEGG